MNKETLYDLRELVALYPYYQTVRILLLQNLYLLHDPTFNEELKRAAIYLTDRRVIFEMVEAAHYQLKAENGQQGLSADATKAVTSGSNAASVATQASATATDRTTDLIDSFLGSIPATDEEKEEGASREGQGRRRRKPTAADAAVDYMKYLMETEEEESVDAETNTSRTISLIDNFIDDGGFKLQPVDTSQPFEPEYTPELPTDEDSNDGAEEKVAGGVFTETLARIYIKQKRYDRALTIMQQLEKAETGQKKRNAYLDDQMRFLEKLIKNGRME